MSSGTRFQWSFRDGVAALAWLGALAFLVYRLLDRAANVPLLPFNNELDDRGWILVAGLLVAGFLLLVFTIAPVAYVMLRTGRWKGMHVAAAVFVTTIAALVFYVPLSYVYERSLGPRKPMHAHLQLFPKAIELPEDREGTLVIAFLGGSTTQFTNWTSEVGRLLQAQFPDRRVITLNQGVQWYTTLHSLINYEANVRHARPDYVVVMHAINDLTANADHSYYVNGPFRRDYGHLMGPMTRLARTRPFFEVMADVAGHMFAWRPRAEIDTDRFPGLPVFAENYRRLVERIRLDGAQPVVMTQPYLYKAELTSQERNKLYMPRQNGAGPERVWSVETARRGMAQYAGAVRALARREGVPLIDLEAAMPKTLEYLIDDCHYSDAGAALVAGRVSEALAGLIRARPAQSAASAQ